MLKRFITVTGASFAHTPIPECNRFGAAARREHASPVGC
jgi:hypothetical protein